MIQSKEYNLKGMIDIDAFDWIHGGSRTKYRRYAEVISQDLSGANVLQAVIVPQGQKSLYQIGGRNIKKFVKIYGPGLKLNNQRYEKNNRDREDRKDR